MKRFAILSLSAGAITLVACGSSQNTGFTESPDGSTTAHDGASAGQEAGGPTPEGGFNVGDGGGGGTCNPTSTDQNRCSCLAAGTMKACYPTNVDPKTRNIGACKDGMQACVKSGEILSYGPCAGAVVPLSEDCQGSVDTNCNGKTGCDDPACATAPACNTGCTNGQTRACYTGPAGSDNVGICRDGVQTCANSKWPTDCPGEVLPEMENCSDAKDHNCNGLAGCLDVFACIFPVPNPACNGTCDPAKVDPGCVCATGTGDTATCAEGSFGNTTGGFPGMEECCPCTASHCDNAGCCAESVCAGSSKCAGLTCKALPASCNGQVNADCDDFPEDCDEPCCKCTTCP